MTLLVLTLALCDVTSANEWSWGKPKNEAVEETVSDLADGSSGGGSVEKEVEKKDDVVFPIKDFQLPDSIRSPRHHEDSERGSAIPRNVGQLPLDQHAEGAEANGEGRFLGIGKKLCKLGIGIDVSIHK